MFCPYCSAAVADGARLCQTCGRLLAPSQPGPPAVPQPNTPSPATPGPYGPFGPRPGFQPQSFSYGNDPYRPLFDVRQLPPETAAAYRQHRFHATFSVTLAILVHFLTISLASPFLIARKYAFLPKIKRDDFSTARAAGFLFIPFFNLYWVFILCHRIVDRLALQTKLWGVPPPPSKGLATTVGVFWVLSGVLGSIPAVGIIPVFAFHAIIWPIYHGQIQATCNRLALAAAPDPARPAMLQLERWTRLRWFGWMLIGPTVCLSAGTIGTMLAGTLPSRTEAAGVLLVYAVVAAGGGALLYYGSRSTRDLYHTLSGFAPPIVAGYLRIDKNAAWTFVWITVPLALLLVAATLGTLASPTPDNPASNAWSTLSVAAAVGGFAVYATVKALSLKRQIAWLEEYTPPPGYDVGSVTL